MVIALILSIAAWVIILACLIGSMRNNSKIRRREADAVQAGLELSRNAVANDKALREGLEDQKEIYQAEIMELDDKIKGLEEDLIASRGNLNRLLTKIHDLQTAHAMHTDHCLPVLEEMRSVQLIEPEPAATAAEKFLAENARSFFDVKEAN